jgi:hypothetical protein
MHMHGKRKKNQNVSTMYVNHQNKLIDKYNKIKLSHPPFLNHSFRIKMRAKPLGAKDYKLRPYPTKKPFTYMYIVFSKTIARIFWTDFDQTLHACKMSKTQFSVLFSITLPSCASFIFFKLLKCVLCCVPLC